MTNVQQNPLPEKRRPVWLGRFALTSAVSATVLWTLGAFGTPRPEFLGALLCLTLACGVVSSLGGLIRFKSSSLLTVLLGLAGATAAIVFAAAIFSNQEGPLPIVPGAEKRRSPDRLRVVIFNMLGGYPELEHQEARFRDTLAAFRALDPDVLILQEAWQTHAHGNMAQRVAKHLKMDHVYARANGGARLIGFEEGSAIISRYPIVEAKRMVLSPRWPIYETRIAVSASIDLGREKVMVVGTHLTCWDDATTAAQTENLLARLPEHDLLLVAGDFNAASESPAVKRMLDAEFIDKLPGGIDHLFMPKVNRTRWLLQEVRRTPHNAVVADFARRRG